MYLMLLCISPFLCYTAAFCFCMPFLKLTSTHTTTKITNGEHPGMREVLILINYRRRRDFTVLRQAERAARCKCMPELRARSIRARQNSQL